MKWTTSNIDILRSPLGVMVVIPAPQDNDLSKITTDKEYTVEIKRKTKLRSLNANSYCWLIAHKIAVELSKIATQQKRMCTKRLSRTADISHMFQSVRMQLNAT